MLIHNAQVTGSLILNGIDIGDITGSEVSIGALNSFSASINVYTGSNNININALQTFSSSILTYTGSNDTLNNTQNSRLSSLETTSGSLLTASGSFSTRVSNTETTSSNLTTASSSFSTRVANNESTGSNLVAASASFSTRVTNNESNISSLTTASGSFSTRTTNLETASGSFSTRVTNAESSITSLNSKTGSYATTSSNAFSGSQIITGSLTVTGTITAQTLNVQQVTSSIVYSSGSNIFGNSVSNTQQFTGSLQVSSSTSYILGNVGIGTTSPGYKLDVLGNIQINNTNPILYIRSGNSETSTIGFTQPAVTGYGGFIKAGTGLGDRYISFGLSAAGTNNDATELVRIDDSGNVGIGTTSPITNLHVVNNTNVGLRLQATAANGSSELDLLSNGTQNAFLDYGPNQLRFRSTNSDMSAIVSGSVLVLNNNGCVGIGTDSPGQLLEIRGNDGQGIRIKNAGSSDKRWDIVGSGNDLRINETGVGAVMSIQAGGNVGIGNTSPSYKLDVSGTGRFSTELRITDVPASAYAIKTVSTDWANGSTIFTGIKIGAAADTFAAGIDLRAISNYASTSGTQFAIAVNSTGNTMTEVLRINAAGNVGIGTTSPAYKLDVSGQVRFITSSNSVVDILSLDNTSVVSAGVRQLFNNGYGNLAAIRVLQRDNGSLADDGQLDFQVASNASLDTKMTILNTGNVGIGTASPGDKLDVVGNITLNAGYKFYNGSANNSAGIDFDSSYVSLSGYNGIRFFASNTGVGSMTQRMIITSDGNLLVGTTSLRTTGYTTGNSQYAMENTGYGGAQWFTNRNDEEGSYIVLGKSRGTTVNSNTVVASGDILGAIIFQGTDGTNSDPAAMIRSRVDGTPGSNDMPGRLEFLTTADGSATLTERMRITSGGAVGIGTTSPRTKTEFSSGLPTSIPTRTNTTNGIAITDGGAIYGRIGVADLSAGSAGYPTYIQGGDWDGASYYNLLLSPLGGNVGIGTTSPYARLSVVQDISTTAEFGSFGQFTLQGATNPNKLLSFGFNTATNVGFIQAMVNGTSYNNLLLNARGGNVGIGTTSPDGKLDIQASSTGTVLTRLWNTDTSGTGASALRIANSGNNNDGGRIEFSDAAYYVATIAGDRTQGLTFRTSATGGSPTGISIRMIILPNGNVGIGTTSPGAKLDVAGSLTVGTGLSGANTDIKILNATNSTTHYIFSDQSSGQLGIESGTSAGIKFNTNGPSTRMVILSGGNVGIGTTAPGETLTIGQNTAGNSTAYSLSILRNGTSVSPGTWLSTPAINITDIAGDGPSSVSNTNAILQLNLPRVADGDTFSNNAFFINCVNDNGSAFVVTGKRNVGIGTTSPSTTLDVNGTATATLFSAPEFYNATGYPYNTTFGSGANASTATLRAGSTSGFQTSIVLQGGDVGNTIILSTASSERMRITSGGNVGIGTSSPSHRLDINGGANDTTLRVQTTGQNPVRFRLTNEEREFILTNNPGDDLLSFYYADLNRLQFNTTNQWFPNGNVGIGTTSPSTKLEVNGTITETSSIRYKENIETIKYGLDKVVQMRGVTYDRKDSGLKEVGVIAEEINEIFPDLVVKNEEGLVESVSYGRITALLIEAIKELKIEIEELKANR